MEGLIFGILQYIIRLLTYNEIQKAHFEPMKSAWPVCTIPC